MTLVPTTAAGAVYHDALTTARKFRTLCFVVLLLSLLTAIGLFLAAKFSPEVRGFLGMGGESAEGEPLAAGITQIALAALLWLGLVFSILLSLTLLFATLVMLNGRTVGVSRMARAFLWSLVLLLLFVPWQSLLTHPDVRGGPFHVPGVLYTAPELRANVPQFFEPDVAGQVLGWLRFVAWPIVALVLLLIVWLGSGKAIKQALGLDLPDADEEADHDAPMNDVVT